MTNEEMQEKWYKVYCEENLKKHKEEKEMSKYTREEIDDMKQLLAESEWEHLKDRDLRGILWHGCVGWHNMEDVEVIEMYEEIYGFDVDGEPQAVFGSETNVEL